jgi:integrase
MIGPMPRRLPYLQRETTRHGRTAWYVRLDRGQRIRIRGEYASPEFMAAYRAALAGEPIKAPGRADPRSLAWLVEEWRRSSDWASTANSTRRQRENVLRRVVAANPRAPFAAITPEHVRQGREDRKATPAAANNFIKTMRALFRWAVEAGHLGENPAAGVAFIPTKSTGFHPWTMEDLARFRARWPLGTRERIAVEVLATTGLRRGDAARLGPQHLKDGVFAIRTEKTGETVHRPLLPELARAIEAGPVGDLAYITGANGRPMVKESFGNWFRKACNAAKVPGSAHGVRKLAATTLAEHGATNEELKAAFGWQTNEQSATYTRTADRRRLAIQAAQKLTAGTESE